MILNNLQGIYYNSSIVNGKQSWNSTNGALWYAEGAWIFGSYEMMGHYFGDVYSPFGNQCPFDLSSKKWYYSHWSNGWIIAEENEIYVLCLNGNILES